MKPISFKGQTAIFGADQKEYKPLPALRTDEGDVITCWKVEIWERLHILFTGKVWLTQKTFFAPVQPVLLETVSPIQNSPG